MQRKIVTLILALVLMVVVMGIAAVLYFTGPPREKWVVERQWRVETADVETIKGINMAGDKTDEVFVQSTTGILILDDAGQTLYEMPLANGKSTMGDLNDDGLDEFVAIAPPAGGLPSVQAFTSAGQRLWSQELPRMAAPSRATSVDLAGDGVREIVIGDNIGQLFCLGSDGRLLWEYRLPEAPADAQYVRGLDDVALAGGGALVAAANYEGDIVLLDAGGEMVWESMFPERIRRLRAYDQDGDGAAELILGGENGEVIAFDQTGWPLWDDSAGSRVTEMRDAELDGGLATREVVVGTKDGLVLGFDASGAEVFRASLGNRVEALVSLDLDGDGREELLAGSETGDLVLFEAGGGRLAEVGVGSAVAGLDAGKRLEQGAFILSTVSDVSLRRAKMATAPRWYNPLTAGLVACLIIAAGAWALTGVRPPPKLEYSAEELTVEALRAKRRMLKESLAEVRRLQDTGEIPPDAYTARMRELRGHIARVEADLIKQGVKITPEVMQCPNCGGALAIGADRCEYCGQTFI